MFRSSKVNVGQAVLLPVLVRRREFWSVIVLAAALCLAAGAQTMTDLESAPVNRVAGKLSCSCGCKMDMTCKMEPYMCGTCKRYKSEIWQMQQGHKTDDEILAAIAARDGQDILAIPPGGIGSALSYTGLGVGLALVLWFIRKYRGKAAPANAAPVDDPLLDRYHDQIEKETAKLE